MSHSQSVFVPVVFSLLLIAGSQVAQADVPLIFTGASGSRAAQADFSLTGSTLTVTLTNTSSADVLVPTDVLVAMLFNTTHTLTPTSADLNGSGVYYGSIVNNVGEGWNYTSGLGTAAHGNNSGISAAGLGLFGQPNFYAQPVTPLDGIGYGILSAGDNTTTGNGGLSGRPLIKNSVQFTLTASSGFSLSELGSNVVFQYGTALTEPSFNGTLQTVPEPSSLWSLIVMLGAVGCGVLVKYKRLV